MNGKHKLSECKIGFVGGGNMARAIIAPLLSRKIVSPNNIVVSAKTSETLNRWITYGVRITKQNHELAPLCDIIFLATKPQCLKLALHELFIDQENLRNKLFVSIAVGVTLHSLSEMLKSYGHFHPKFMRIMPNMPLNICEGITLYCSNEHVTENDASPVIELFSHLGMIEAINESLMNAAGGLTGCGPAYAYLIIEALADGAVKNGVPRALATKFAAQILVGAGKMVLKTEKHPGQLKDEVCSPGGATIAGIYQLEVGSVRGSMMNAVEAAVNRSKELGS